LVAYLFCRVLSAVRDRRQHGRGCYVLNFPLCLGDFFGNFFYPVFVVSNEADPALGVPHGNDLQFPGVVFGICMFFQKGTLAHWSGSGGIVPRMSRPIVGSDESCDGAVELVDS